MVRKGPGYFGGDVAACARVYCQDCGDVAMGLRLFTCAYLAYDFDSTGVDTVCKQAAFYDAVLVAAIKTNPCTTFLYQTKETTTLDCYEVHRRLPCNGRLSRGVDRSTCHIPGSDRS